jgi:SAM-dependent methyltransferase
MKLSDQVHCPHCKGRLSAVSGDGLRCTGCQHVIPVVGGPLPGGIADFVAGSLPLADATDHYRGDPRRNEPKRPDLFTRMQIAASDRWPTSFGDTIEFGCGRGETTHAIVAGQTFRSLLVLDTEIETLQACRSRIGALGFGPDRPVSYATLSGAQDVLRDGVADTVIGTGLLPGIGDVGAFLAMAHRVLRPNGRALFVVPNRRYYEAMCLAIAQGLVQRYARDRVWPEGQYVALELLAHTRRLLVHRGDQAFLSGLDVKHLFDSELLEELGAEAGFAGAAMIPLDPDPAGAETIHRVCQDAGAPEVFTETFGALAATVGQPFFNLLSRRDASASMLLWLTKGPGPNVRVFAHRPPAQLIQGGADAAVGCAPPRWSVELLARDTANGIAVTLGGWCLCNTDVRWVRLTLDEVTRHAPVWRPRPDVHEVLNRNGTYHPLNTLCSGMASELLFDGVHAVGNRLRFRLDILLANGLIISGPAPDALVMDEPMVVAH